MDMSLLEAIKIINITIIILMGIMKLYGNHYIKDMY